jgi:hypothetical protein
MFEKWDNKFMSATLAAPSMPRLRPVAATSSSTSQKQKDGGSAPREPLAVGAPVTADIASAIAELSSAAVECVRSTRYSASQLDDVALLEHQQQLAHAARQLDLAAASLAAEVAHRSRRELGYSGLAQRHGARTPEALVQSITGTSSPTARRLVRVGALVAQLDQPATITESWLTPLLDCVASGLVSAEALDVVRAALGAPTDTVDADALRTAVATLTDLVPHVTLESLAARARELRDDLDASGVAARENERRERRSLRLYPQVDGMTRLVGLLDPESAAVLTSAIDAATSPRRGGPRFVDPSAADAAQRVIDDPRTTEQLALDALVELVDAALRSRFTTTPAQRRAAVRVLVTQSDLDRRGPDRGNGAAHIDGQTASVSIATADRYACDGGLMPILFDDDGSTLNLGRSQRLHSARQRIAIAVRDGGCLAPDCERPASWCEVHHIHEFSRGGKTDLNDGVLLCRHHHMLVHNNGWRIERRGNRYWMLPPPDLNGAHTHPSPAPILLGTKSAAVRRMLSDNRPTDRHHVSIQ